MNTKAASRLRLPRSPAAARAAAALLAAAAGVACHDGGGGGGTTQDLEVLGVRTNATALPPTGPAAALGHELRVGVRLSAASAARDVALTFLAADAAEVEAGASEPTLHELDSEPVAEVRQGTDEYWLQLELPTDVPPGAYYLIAAVDPLGATPETEEGDNASPAHEIERLGARLTLTAPSATPDVVLESIVLDELLVDVNLLELPQPPLPGFSEHPNGELGLTATLRSTHALADVELRVELEVPGFGVHHLRHWDSALSSYVFTFSAGALAAGEPTVVHLDADLSPLSRNDLFAILGPTTRVFPNARVRVRVDPNDDLAEAEAGIVLPADDDGDDNLEHAEVALRFHGTLPRAGGTAGELDWEVPFVKGFTNGNVGVALRFGANANVGSNGLYAEASASVPVTLAGTAFDFCSLDAQGLYDPLHDADNGFVVTLKALNVKLYERRTKEDERLASDPLSFQKEASVSSTFLVGPVPIFVRLGARGTVGLDVGASIGGELELHAKPSAELTAFAEGGVGASYAGWTLGGGVGADLELVDETFHAEMRASLDYDDATSTLTGSVTEEVANELAGPSGRVYLFATAEGKILWKTISERWEHVLASWKPFVKSDTLFRQTQSVSVVVD